MLADLIAQIEEHLAWRAAHEAKLAESTFGLRAVNDGKLLERLRGGGQITVDKMQRVQRWIAEDRQQVMATATACGQRPSQDAA